MGTEQPGGSAKSGRQAERVEVGNQWQVTDFADDRKREKVQPDDWGGATPFHPRERKLLTISLIVALSALVILLAIAVLAFIPICRTAPIPPDPASMNPQSVAAYKELLQLWNAHELEVIKLFAAQILLPIITAVLGYLFGSRGREG